MAKRSFFETVLRTVGMLALLVLAGVGCSQKAGAQSGGGSAGKALAKSLETALAGEADAFIEALQKASPAAIAALPAPPAQDFSYKLNGAGDGVIITKYTGTNPVLIIPATIEGYPVVEVSGFNKGGTKVPLTVTVIPENVKVIGNGGTYGVTGAFENQASLKSVILPASITTIGLNTFLNCTELNNLILPESVTAIDFPEIEGFANKSSFKGCKQLPLPVRKRLQDMGCGTI